MPPPARPACITVKLLGQRMGAEPEFHQGFCFRKSGCRETIVCLKAPHGLACGIVPVAAGICFQVACLAQGFLDLLDAIRLRAQQGPAAPFRGSPLPRGNIPAGGVVGVAALAALS